MKIRIDARVFEDVVSTAALAISSKPMKPEYECVFVEVRSDAGIPVMTVTAKDTGISIKKATDNLQVIDDGDALIPAKTLLSFLKLMKGEVEIDVDSHFKAALKCGGKRVSISCMDSEDTSSDFTALGDENTVEMDGKAFVRSVQGVTHCISADQARMVLTGVHFTFDAESGKAEATGLDGFRMAIVRETAETNETFSALIPIEVSKLIAKIIGASENVSFRFDNGIVIVDDYTTSIEASLLSGEYPEYDKLVPKDKSMRVKVNLASLTDAVKLAMISADSNKKGLIVFKFSGEDGMNVSAMAEKCEADTSIAVDISGNMEGGADEIAFNGKYVLEALKAAENYGEEIELLLNKPNSPMAIIPVWRDDFYQLVLPVRRMV
jgi:DNA polymerase-3 subunit beta